MVTINISDELYTQITKTLNDTRNAKNSMTHELESQQLDLDTAISELKHPSAVVELMKASSNAQANIELLNTILRSVKVENVISQTIEKISHDPIIKDAELILSGDIKNTPASNGQVFNLNAGESISCNIDDVGFGVFTRWSKDITVSGVNNE